MTDEAKEMLVKKSIETKTYITYTTATHSFKIEEGALEKLEGQYAELQKKIEQGQKMLVDTERPEWRVNSWKSIFKAITGQNLLDDFEKTEE